MDKIVKLNTQSVNEYQPTSDLSEKAKKIWDETLNKLVENNVINNLDMRLLTRYCRYAVEMDDLLSFREKTPALGNWVDTPKGPVFKKHPEILRLETLEPQFMAIERQLGLAAMSRKRNKLGKDDSKEKTFEEIFSRDGRNDQQRVKN